MLGSFFVLFIGLELKHYLADYFLQPSWIIAGKGDFRQPGGYAHAGIHAALTGVVLLVAGASLPLIGLIVLGEFVVHYLLDYGKIRYSAGVHITNKPSQFWALHGVDQMLHQLTYAAIIYLVIINLPA
jgi:hypothetical protein